MQHIFWSWLMKYVNMKQLQLILWKIPSGYYKNFGLQTERWMDRQTDRRTKWNQYTPVNFVGSGYNDGLVYWHIYASLSLNKLALLDYQVLNPGDLVLRAHYSVNGTVSIKTWQSNMTFQIHKRNLKLISQKGFVTPMIWNWSYSKLKLCNVQIFSQFIFIMPLVQRAISIQIYHLNTLRPRQNRHHFADNFLKCIFMNETFCIWIRISLKFASKDQLTLSDHWFR